MVRGGLNPDFMKKLLPVLAAFSFAVSTFGQALPVTANADGTFRPLTSGATPHSAGFPVSVDAYGAVGDGTTNDTTAITNAITAAGANGVVLFTAGKTYKTISQITVASDGVTLSGYGAAITSDTDVHDQKFLFSGRSNCRIFGLTFNCIYTTATLAGGIGVIELRNSVDCLIRDCSFNDVANCGVFLYGTSTRCTVKDNRFYHNFVAIETDDDGTNQPTYVQISGNNIRTGLGGTGTNFSGGIKFSGTGNSNSVSGDIIANNDIINPGQVGIELQGWMNSSVIQGNHVTGSAFGISLSGVSDCTINGNAIRSVVANGFGIEMADSCSRIAVTGNQVEGANASGTPTTRFGIMPNTGDQITITGNQVSNCTDEEINIYFCTNVAICGNVTNGEGLQVVGSTGVSITGNYLTATNSPNYFIFVDSTAANCSQISITGNHFSGAVTNEGILLAHSANVIQDVLIARNMVSGASSGAGMINDSGAGILRRIRIRDNIGTGDQSFFTNIGLDFWSSSGTIPLNYGQHTVSVDASAGAATRTLPPAVNLAGEQYTIIKSDSSGNAVSVATTSSQTISGNNAGGTYVSATTYSLAAQGSRVTVLSDGSNWAIVQAR